MKINLQDIKSIGIRSECERLGLESIEYVGEVGDGDWRIILWDLGCTMAIETNGDPIWQEEDPQAFQELADQILEVVR